MKKEPWLVWLSRLSNGKICWMISSQGTHLGCRPGPQLGASERQLIDVPNILEFVVMVVQLVNTQKTTELYTLKGGILWCMNYIWIKIFA